MKILQVSTSDVGGGAERAARLLHDAWLAARHDAWLVVGERKGHDPRVVTLHESPHIDYRRYGRPGRLRRLERLRRLDRALGLEPFRFPYSHRLRDLTGSPPDVVHAHNLHGGYFDLRALPALSRRVPTFLSLHDQWSFTGHCAFPFDCTRWQSGCGACPDLTIPPAVARDATRFNWHRKRRIWRRSRIHAVFPSEWLMQLAERSILAEGIVEARVVPYPVDLSAFTPGDRAAARHALDVPADASVLLFVARDTFDNPFKDGPTVRAVAERLAATRSEPVWLVALGGAGGEARRGNLVVRELPFADDPGRMVAWYRASDALLHATRQEVSPLVILEALACECPVVATAVAGIPEVVEDGKTGRLFGPADVGAAAEAVAGVLDRPDEAAERARAGSARIRERHDRTQVAQALLGWYEEARSR